ncbi:DnaQ-like DNA polymerase III subunit [Arthrobacter phage Isolde]|uniref:Exonuclease n=1 Tax=Arthrobacter phage Isolde TaxID=2419610 RepID=A0A3G3M3Q5_9CAUD|nr:Rnase H [Arthrobacter phage Isolde]AYR01056.1 DnaQ-like DNA polymerase III subunit [Arthrobacter phage Isolde]
MKYFYDTEFHENGRTIDLISIGIVAEDGREYYAVNRDADWNRIGAHQWLTANVVPHLPPMTEWKPKAQIRDEVADFLLQGGKFIVQGGPPELWAWFCSYDHVVLAQLFGTMLDLPDGIPMYTNDVRSLVDWTGVHDLPQQSGSLHDALADARHVKAMYEHITNLRTDAAVPFAPKVAPFGWDVGPESVQEVWDTFVKPDQDSDKPQSAEMRALMAILRAAYVSVGGK